ncbi:MAG: hypothetical protein ACOVNZ_08335 [Crocinitomicaceae bacterium]|jgi:hypothetical protein
MKTKLFIFLIFCSRLTELNAQKQFALEMPEYNTLYEGYQNKVFVASKNGKVVNPKCQSADIKEDKYNGRSCLTINPKVQGDILVYFDVVNVKGKKIGSDSVSFFVRSLPSPVVLTSTISKLTGSKITIGLSPDCPISSPNFEVLSIEVMGIENGSVSGNIIPASIISNIEVDRSIGITVICKNSYNGQTLVVAGSLRVTN